MKKPVVTAFAFLIFSCLQALSVHAGITYYNYDDLNRLTRVERSGGTVISYTYDDAGNRTSKSTTSSTLIYTFLTSASPNIVIEAGTEALVYGTSVSNQVTLGSGASAELINFPGQNIINIQSNSNLFTVFRSGTVVTFQGSDGTLLKIPATTDIQTISFNGEKSWVLQIYNKGVMLDDQVITPTPASIEGYE